MSNIEIVAPGLLRDCYALLPNGDKTEFLKMIGRQSAAEALFVVLGEMPIAEQMRFSAILNWAMKQRGFLHRVVNYVCEVIQGMPELMLPDRRAELVSKVKEFDDRFIETIVDNVVAEQNQKRGKSRPEIVTRNVEICDKRIKGSTLGQLAMDYNLSRETVKEIVNADARWRAKLAKTQGVGGRYSPYTS